MTSPLALEPQGDGWRLILSGDWSLAAMPSVEAQLKSLPATLHGNLVCDWTQAQTPGISPAWALLRRLAQAAPPLDVSHTGNPPHFLELLQKLHVDRHAAYSVQAPEPTLERLVGKLGRWSVLQGVHARGVIVFLGRIATVIGQAFSRPRAWRLSSLVAAYLRNRHHRDSDRRIDRIPDQRDRGLSRRAAAVALRRRHIRGGPGDHRHVARDGRAADGDHRRGPIRQRLCRGNRRHAAQRGNRRAARHGNESRSSCWWCRACSRCSSRCRC